MSVEEKTKDRLREICFSLKFRHLFITFLVSLHLLSCGEQPNTTLHFSHRSVSSCHCQKIKNKSHPLIHHCQVPISSVFPPLLHSQLTPDSDAPTRCSSSHYFYGYMHPHPSYRHHPPPHIHSVDDNLKKESDMEVDLQRSRSLRLSRRGDRSNQNPAKDVDVGLFSSGRASQDYPMKIVWKKGFVRLVLVVGILWMLLILLALLFHIWSCQTSVSILSAMCNKDSKVYTMLDTMGLVSKDSKPHRCPIPLSNDPDKINIPTGRTPNEIVKNLSYVMEDEVPSNGAQSSPLFGGHPSWKQREESFKLKSNMKVHCGFIEGGGAEMEHVDIKYVKKCKFVVASGIFDGYDLPHQPSNISFSSKKLFCFLMVVDEVSLKFMRENGTVKEDSAGGKWVGIWRIILLKHPPYDEPRRNGKVPKILTHRLFPEAQYSIWIDGKMELIVDPLQILERYLWRGKHTFAIAQHKHHRSIYEEADANKRRKRYARPLIDLHMKIYYYEGMKPWSSSKKTISDVPEGAIIIREHTAMNNLFSCLWFNEVHLFTPRDQLSFGYAAYRLGDSFKYFMFPNCEYNSLFLLHPHTREHSSPIEWVKDLNKLKNSNLRESRGGLGLFTPYPGDLDSVVLPNVTRISKAG